MTTFTLAAVLLLFSLAPAVGTAAATPPLLDSDEIVSELLLHNAQRQLFLNGYEGMRLYALENERMHKHAEMLVRVTCNADGSKQFQVVAQEGWKAANKHVLIKMLASEEETSRPEERVKTQLNTQNYTFRGAGTEQLNGRLTYVLEVLPKRHEKYLFKGRIWVDADDFAVIRAEGEPAKRPSFWTRSIHFVQTYEKNGSYWFPTLTQSRTQAFIFGATDVSIQYFAYRPKTASIEPSTASVGKKVSEAVKPSN